jgi:hypothetical protein
MRSPSDVIERDVAQEGGSWRWWCAGAKHDAVGRAMSYRHHHQGARRRFGTRAVLDDLDSLAGEFDELLQEAPVDLPELAGHPYTVWVVSKALCL